MDFNDTPEEAAFRKEVRAWLDANATRKSDDKRSFRARSDDPDLLKKAKAWQDRKAAAGYARITWPKEYGGRAVPLSQQVIFYQEYARAGGPGRVGHIGEGLVAPTIIALSCGVNGVVMTARVPRGAR